MDLHAAGRARRALLMGLQFGAPVAAFPLIMESLPPHIRESGLAFALAALIGALSAWRLRRGYRPMISFAIAYPIAIIPIATSLITFQGRGAERLPLSTMAGLGLYVGAAWAIVAAIACAGIRGDKRARVYGIVGFALGGAVGGFFSSLLLRVGLAAGAIFVLAPTTGGAALGWATFRPETEAPSEPPD
jgi:hypothetical protein